MDNIEIPLDLYKIFCTVVATGSMSVAARELYVSQPAISMAIRQLEQRFGRPLLVRSSKGIRTTPEGEVLYKYVSQGLGLIKMAEKKYFEMHDLEMGEVRIGANDTILTHYLLPYIEKYIQSYEFINIKATNKTSAETVNLLKTGKVDIVFVNLPLQEDDNIEIFECMTIHDCIIGGTKFMELAKDGISIKDINNYPLLLLEKASITRGFIDKYAGNHGTILIPKIELGSMDLLLNFASINLGITFTVKEFYQDVLSEKQLYEIPVREPIPPRSIGLAKLKGVPLSYAASKFTDFIKLDSKS